MNFVIAYMDIYVQVPGACRDQTRLYDPIELQLQIAVSYHVGAGN